MPVAVTARVADTAGAPLRQADRGRAVNAWIGLGGNHKDSERLLREALSMIGDEPGIELLRCSRLYRSPPWGFLPQDEFVNAVAECDTDLRPRALLGILLDIERRLGRVRTGPRWGPRNIDLDLLTCGERIVETPALTLPHPRMHQRAFVLVPLLELEPEFEIPGRGSAAGCLRQLDRREIESVAPLVEPAEKE